MWEKKSGSVSLGYRILVERFEREVKEEWTRLSFNNRHVAKRANMKSSYFNYADTINEKKIPKALATILAGVHDREALVA